MCVPENTSRPANVGIVCPRCTIHAMQQAANSYVGKGVAFFDSLKMPFQGKGISIDKRLDEGQGQGQQNEDQCDPLGPLCQLSICRLCLVLGQEGLACTADSAQAGVLAGLTDDEGDQDNACQDL